MIGDLIFDTELAEPAIGQINLYLRAQPPLRTQCKHVAHQQHPDHQNWVNRGAACVWVVRPKLPVHPTEVKNRVDLSDQMVGWNDLVEIKRIQELDLHILPRSHHSPASVSRR